MKTKRTSVWVTTTEGEFMISCEDAIFALKIGQLFSEDKIESVCFIDERDSSSFTFDRVEFDSASDMRCAFESEVLERAY